MAIKKIEKETKDISIIIGHPLYENEIIYNAASIISNGKIIHQHKKNHLPNYGVFEEKRYFTDDKIISNIILDGIKCCVLICEDLWHKSTKIKLDKLQPDIIFCINASPFEIDKVKKRELAVKNICPNKTYFCYLNMCGAQDSLVFDGGSFITDNKGNIIASAKQFREERVNFTYNLQERKIYDTKVSKKESSIEQTYHALVLGIREYIFKNNIPGIVLGLSGGIDSALSLAICTEAIGAKKIKCIFLPSKFTSKKSHELAKKQALLLGVTLDTINIDSLVCCAKELTEVCENTITYQNIQARSRALILMTISNNTNFILANTSNRSELATGYGTLYGDMCGGYSILKNIPKTLVFKLSKWLNINKTTIVAEIISREPSAELAYEQNDSDDLPPYDILDEIIACYIDKGFSLDKIISLGFDEAVTKKIIKLIDKNEHKRHQAPPGVQLSHTSFGIGRRMPIAR